MNKIQAIKKAIFKVLEKRTLFLPSTRILRDKWWGRPTTVILTAVSVMAFLGLAAPTFANIGTGYVYPAFAYLLEAISALIGQILLWAIDLLIQISSYNSFLDANVVSVGWVLVRDVANMFFILIMLVIAFGTMLKIEAYSWKKLLPRLILTALLVNFSKTFIGLLIDFSQVIMLTFVNGYAAAAGGNFMKLFQIEELFKSYALSPQDIDVSFGGNVEFKVLMGFALGTVMLGISLIVILIFVAILLFRIITLWILIVLSPLAFLLGTFPKGQEYYGQWWKQLQGQIIVGPMVAFFLWLSLAALGGGDNNAQIAYESAKGQDLKTLPAIDTSTEAGKWDNMASFAISIAMLLMSLQMIQQLGVAGAGLASGALSTIKSRATGLAKKLAVPVALGVATGGVGTGLMAWGGLKVGQFAGGKVKEGVKEWYDIKKQEIKTGILGRAKEGKFTMGLGAYSMYKMKMRQRKELAESKEKRVVEPLVGKMKDEARARAAGLTDAQIKSGARVSNEEAMVLAGQDKEHEARISQGITTAAQYEERSNALQAAYGDAVTRKDTSAQSNIRQALLDLIGSSVEGHSIDDAMGGKSEYKTVEGKVQMLKDFGMFDDSKIGARLERVFQSMNKSTSVDYRGFEDLTQNKEKTLPELREMIKGKQSFAFNNLTVAERLQQHSDNVTHGEFKDQFKADLMNADARTLGSARRRVIGAAALGINNIALNDNGMAWDNQRQNEGGKVFRLPPEQFQKMIAAMKDINKKDAVDKILRQLGIEDKAETKIVQSTWDKDTKKWVDDKSTETTFGEKAYAGKYRPSEQKTPMEQVKAMIKEQPSKAEKGVFRLKDTDSESNPLPDLDAITNTASRDAAQNIREAAITFGATIDKAGVALRQRLNALQADNPAAVAPLISQLNELVAINRKGLVLDVATQNQKAGELAQLDTQAKEIESAST
ncbi:MAG TPA: hypothetical protein DEB73_03845 [Candidatus Magasanikbacteria bacterium]|uniref:Uncharacterized protein n=1 Tax=Candidatus Magasanikbacteria bacterium GW2011_GWC2_41_17 TaxID=1619048 RepID=A0A0G0VEL5_9BACT|nr:MAG: hypothetical protein UU49_C0008G0018 [Candidatus Magasanikbacteria bacterium GW2011_GWC2_41_17]HBV58360.1 hypothetical protein [Candidatus Magasanikbacteria bacterium]HBX16179.1 hypothetical protein [Candidatus Magasanikbacteria bacterium]